MASKKMGLNKIVEGFLSLAMVPPEKEPRTKRAQRDNDMIILGYNRAQEDLRTLIKEHGSVESVRRLSEVRDPNQRRPQQIGDMRVWIG